jgi:excisionase family DNA binding protein
MTSTDRLLYDAPAAAELLSTSVRRVHELRRAGTLCAVEDGRVMKFTRAELERYIAGLPTFEPKRAEQVAS